MRPHRLRVTAFGAFGGTVQVSFDDLASSGLFLLHGETGAGKTTLLDAIGFALYGRVPGERGKARRLRSDHAASGTPTEVQLEATIGGRRMRITRRPEQERAKLRGVGTTTEQAKVLLEELTGASWQAVSTRAGEADTEIADLMGMSADQFFQVVLLPQGEFAKFLHADAGDRAKLLQRLFGTDRFHAVEEWLADHRRVTARAVEEAEGGIKAHLARVTQAAGLEDSDDPEPSSEPQSASAPSLPGSRLPSATWAAQLAETAAAEAEASASQVTSYRGDLDQALDLLRENERLEVLGLADSTTVSVTVHKFPSIAKTTEVHLVRSADSVALRPMTLEEAIKEAHFRDRDIFVFRDPKGKLMVLHRTRDGKMELIEAP